MAQQHKLDCDVLVAGGGMAGVCTALAAARHGARVILVQDRSVLGGNASSEVRMHLCGADVSGKRPDARETGLVEMIRIEDAVHNPQRSASLFDLKLWELVTQEPNITLMLNTALTSVRMAAPDRIASIHALRHSTEDEFTVEAGLFVDCTGDGRLGSEAGADYRIGREGQAEFNESYAPEQPDRKTLGSSILFTSRRYDHPMPFKAPSWVRKFTEEELRLRPHTPFEFGFWWVEWGGQLDTIKDNEQIRDELLRIALGIWDHIKNGGDHGAENWALEWVGVLPGKRESRRLLGDVIMTQHDIEQSVLFPDRVAYGGWPLDWHPPAGVDHPDEKPCIQIPVPLYSIPLRSLYSRNVGNMMMAGRNISTSHIAFSSTRVMATCSVIGQAVGTAAAFCQRTGLTPREVAADRVAEVQQMLLRDDATVLGLSNADPGDLALDASASASSHQPGYGPEKVVSGVTRPVEGNPHEWVSHPEQPLPQWVQVDMPTTQTVKEIHLTFDSGFTRPLTLSHHDWLTERMVRGPQPETVCDYTIELLVDGAWRTVVEERGNYQRKRIHHIDPVAASSLRLTAHATNGDASARVFEVRMYSE